MLASIYQSVITAILTTTDSIAPSKRTRVLSEASLRQEQDRQTAVAKKKKAILAKLRTTKNSATSADTTTSYNSNNAPNSDNNKGVILYNKITIIDLAGASASLAESAKPIGIILTLKYQILRTIDNIIFNIIDPYERTAYIKLTTILNTKKAKADTTTTTTILALLTKYNKTTFLGKIIPF